MRASSTSAAILLLALATPGLAQPPGYPQPLPTPLPLFPGDNWWNVDIRSAPVDPQSAQFIAFIGGANRGLHPDFGGDVEPGNPSDPEIYGMVYVVVPGSQPLRPVVFDYADESDPSAPGRPAGYPIPDAAITEPRWIEGGYPGNQDQGSDQHLLIVDRDHRLLFETWQTRYNAAAQRWEAGSGAVFPLASNARRPEGWTSADAAGLAVLPGLVRYDEAFATDPIRHALRVTIHDTNGHVFPASHTACSACPASAPPLGARLRLKASVDLSRFPAYLQRIFQAMKTYGLIVADNGSDLYVSATYDTRWNNDELNPAFANLRATDFEVVKLGWRPGGGATVPAAPSALTARALARRSVRLRWRDNSSNETGFSVEMRAPGRQFRQVATTTANRTVAVIAGLAPGTRYVFRVDARNATGASGYSNSATVTTPR